MAFFSQCQVAVYILIGLEVAKPKVDYLATDVLSKEKEMARTLGPGRLV